MVGAVGVEAVGAVVMRRSFLDERRTQLFEFTCRLAQLRRQHPNFKRRSFSEHDPSVASQSENVRWIRVDGRTMADEDWNDGGWKRTLGMLLFGDAPEIRDSEGTTVTDDDFLLLLNSHHEPVHFELPRDCSGNWYVALDTAQPQLADERFEHERVKLEGRSMVVLGRKR